MKMLFWLLCASFCLIPAPLTAQEPREAGFRELIVIDPAVEENGLPTPIVENGKVEIPPTLHIHPYFYCGDKEYQAQILNGGPTIIIANHPASGQKLYIDAILPAGAPIIAYSPHSITYVYPDRRVSIEYSLLHCDQAIVKYASGRGFVRKGHEEINEVSQKFADYGQKSRLVAEFRDLHRDMGNIAKGSVGVASTTGAVIIERTRALTGILPGVSALKSIGNRADANAAIEEVRQAGQARLREESDSVPTIR